MCILRCILTVLFYKKLLAHKIHKEGFSPVYSIRWNTRFNLLVTIKLFLLTNNPCNNGCISVASLQFGFSKDAEKAIFPEKALSQ